MFGAVTGFQCEQVEKRAALSCPVLIASHLIASQEAIHLIRLSFAST